MAFNATKPNIGTTGGSDALIVRGNLRSFLDQLDAHWAKLNTFISNTGGSEMTQVASYMGFTAADGQTAEQKAQAYYDETNALLGHVNTARAALEQWAARLG